MNCKRMLGSLLAASLAQGLLACTGAQADWKLADLAHNGEFGQAREYIRGRVIKADQPDKSASKDNPDRQYALDRMRLGLMELSDGYASDDAGPWKDLYENILRKGGVNKNSKIVAAAINEDLKVWKGEPFEQALAYHYIALNWAMVGNWGNARAAYENSLFPLNSLGKANFSTVQLVNAATGQPAQNNQPAKPATVNLDVKPQEAKTDFTLGYLMRAVTAKQLQISTGDSNRGDEADVNFKEAVTLAPQLAGLIATLGDTGKYNTLLVVDYGQGPQKIGNGPDNSVASFLPHLLSDNLYLQVTPGQNQGALNFPQVCDVNVMASNYMWNSLEEMRKAKSYIGTSLMAVGAGVVAAGAAEGDRAGAYTMLAGVLIMGVGAAEKAGAHADTRYCELIPQRIYIAPLNISAPNTHLTVQVAGVDSSRMVLVLDPPSGRTATLRYVRLLSPLSEYTSDGLPMDAKGNPIPLDVKGNPTQKVPPISFTRPAWATADKVLYASDESPDTAKMALPYILGGYCVRTPSAEALASYQRAGFLKDMTVDDLKHLYMEEGIALTLADEKGNPSKHILEGGSSLACPEKGTVGFTRLFCEEHAPYVPKSKHVQEVKAQIDAQLHPSEHPPVTIGKT